MQYLASPYTKYPQELGGIWGAYKEAARVAGLLTKQGLEIYSPIVHSHPLAHYGKLDPLDGALWQRIDAPFLALCDECIVAMMAGWRESAGVTHEISEFRRAGKRVRYLDPVTLEISDALREAAA
jgi:hypothetical protein